ncbi:Abhydrolase domain-containing protein 4 [Folsomia candida]|uniref:Abhydrolase domain-containing protein 4 n=1 Tax=Folsomia candida TaxID=158441 RepID=A0A226EU57_FOLCA|nr:Abhydrolase domain-containing protein 4 [Folsomia candida]
MKTFGRWSLMSTLKEFQSSLFTGFYSDGEVGLQILIHLLEIIQWFGRSSRPPQLLPSDWVDTLEQWRLYLKIDKMVLVGFSVGGYIAAKYTIKYPHGVAHLILADPWGFAPIPEPIPSIAQYRTPFWIKYISLGSKYFDVWWMHIRLPGPIIGLEVLSRSMYADFIGKYVVLGVGGVDAFRKYMLYCNVGLPMGEAAYREIMSSIVYAKEPLHDKMHLIRKDIGVTYIYGESSFMPHLDLGDIFNARGFDDGIKVYEFPNSGHDVFLDRRVHFNNLVNEIAAKIIKL